MAEPKADGRAVCGDKDEYKFAYANILKEKELDESVVKSYFTTAADGKRYNVIYYALEMILAVGFRVRGVRGMQKGTRRSTTCGARRKRGLRTRWIWKNCDESRMRRNDAARMENADDSHCARGRDAMVAMKQVHKGGNKWIRSPQYSAAG